MLLKHAEVAADASVFRPDGFIVIPRSDGDPDYTAPNLTVPGPDEAEVNYYHIFDRNEDRHDSWRATIGAMLAEMFGLPSLSPEKKTWKLYDFPQDYDFAEQRKGPRHSPRTDPYLFAKKGHRFRSTREALPHIEWLLLDTSLDPTNCQCKYCGGPKRAGSVTPNTTPSRVRKAAAAGSSSLTKKTTAVPKKQPNLTASAAAAAGTRGRKPAKVTSLAQATAIVIRGVDSRTLTPGVSIDSVPQRDAEIMREIKQGQSEGFRVGEVAWCRLEQPIADPTEPQRQITQWPVLIEDPALMVHVAPTGEQGARSDAGAASPNTDGDSSAFSLAGRVSQQRAYQVRFLGAADATKAPESRLIPFLSGFIPEGLLQSSLGTIEQHSWLSTDEETLFLNLAKKQDEEPPSYAKAIVAFAYAMQTAAILRSTYVSTDVYSAASTGAGVLKDLAGGADGAAPSTPARSAIAGPSTGSPATPTGPPKAIQLYQGLYFGVERLWVGEVVRLKLSMADLKKLQRELNAALVRALPPGAKDPPAVYLDGDASYVMRVGSIYKEVFGHQAHMRIAGELFQVVTAAKYNRAKKEEQERDEREAAAAASGAATAGGAATTSGAATTAGDGAAKQSPTPPGPLRLKLPEPSILRAKPGYPAMPPLPQGFVMIPLTEKIGARLPQEVSLPIEMLAGRIYPSYGVPADGPRVEEQVKLTPGDPKKAAEEDTQDETRARLSVAGLLGGCVKPMLARSEVFSRSTALKAAFEIARSDIARLIADPEAVSEDDELPDESTGVVAEVGGDITVTNQDGAAPGQDATVTTTAAANGKRAATAEAEQEETAAAGVVGKKARLNDEVPTTTTTTAPAPAPAEEEEGKTDEPPLPEGWVTKVSRSSGATYYVYLPTKSTQWERPT